MPPKRRRSSAGEHNQLPGIRKARTEHPLDQISDLSDEILLRILHNLPIRTIVQCQRLSHRFYTLAGDSQIWKNLYYNRFVLPRALRIPGIRAAAVADYALHFSSRASKWLDDDTLVNRVDGKKTNWKKQYKLRHNWSIGACEVREIHVADGPSVPSMFVRVAEGLVITADDKEGLRAWNLKAKELVAMCDLDEDTVPTCLAIDELESNEGLGIALGLMDGGWGVWRLDFANKTFIQTYRHPSSSNGRLSSVAYAKPYVLTITEAQLLSLYTFAPKSPVPEDDLKPPPLGDEVVQQSDAQLPSQASSPPLDHGIQPHLIASLKSHSSWPPLSLSIRSTSTAIIASIAYTQPTYLSGFTIGLQEIHLSLQTNTINSSRIASALPQGFHSILSPTTTPTRTPSHNSLPSSTHSSVPSTSPTSISYSHPYILATHPDNTLSLYLCTSTATTLSISPGTKLWGHTSSVSSAEITPRGKAVSVTTRGNELRVWELEGGFQASTSSWPSSTPSATSAGRKRSKYRFADRSVRIKMEPSNNGGLDDSAANGAGIYDGGGDDGGGDEERGKAINQESQSTPAKPCVGFDDEMVIVLRESGSGRQALMVYDFT